MIPTAPFGATGHASSRVIFGAAALAGMSQPRADSILPLLLDAGVNHIDTAASYGDSELRLASWMAQHRARFFLASKTGERTYAGARDGVRRSLERLGVDRLDLIQMHNLVDEREWETALGPGGALEALVEARDAGLVRFIGVTGHGTQVAARHRQSLERFPFAAVLLPCNFPMMRIASYAEDFRALAVTCRERGVAMQTIKAVARRRWAPEVTRRFSWYEPLTDEAAIRRAVHFVLGQPGLFLNTTSDARLLPAILRAAAEPIEAPDAVSMQHDVDTYAMEALFLPGVTDAI